MYSQNKRVKMGRLESYLVVKNIENLYINLLDWPSCILQPRRAMINTLPCSLQLPLLNTLRNFEFVHLKLDYANLIFHNALSFPDFFLIIMTTKHVFLKHYNRLSGKRHHSCEIRCLIFTLPQLAIPVLITGHVPF